ncbi:hypothetical protein MD484_g2229, partial [Candolleomyces efflorescens]
MEDYLASPKRSGVFFQNRTDTVALFMLASMKHLQQWTHTLLPPTEDKAAAFGALYLCVRFTWEEKPTKTEISILKELWALNIFQFDLTILLGWILLYGRRLWPNPADMLNHMKPQNVPLEGLPDKWLDPIAEGVKLLHTCRASIFLPHQFSTF